MNTDLLFSVADKIRSFKDKAEVIDGLMGGVSDELKQRIAPWKGMSLEDIRGALTDELLGQLESELPSELKFLLVPVGELDNHMINVGDWSKEDKTLAPVKVTTSATGSIELDGVLDDDLHDVLKGPVAAGSALFTVSLNGQIGIDAKGAGGTPVVSLSLAAAASRAQTLTVGFVLDAKQPVLLELLRIRDYFVNPADLSAVMAFFADKSGRLIQHHYDGKHSLGLKIGLQQSLANALLDLAPGANVEASGGAAMSFSVTLKNDDDFKLTIESDTAASAFVNLERKRVRERTRVFKIGVSIEIKGLKQQIVKKIGELLPDNPKVEESLRKLDELVDEVEGADLGDLVGKELAAHFDDHAELFEKLLGNTSVENAKQSVIDELKGTLVDRINERVNLLSDSSSDAANRIAEDVSAALGVDEAGLRDFLSGSTKSAIEALQRKLDEKINGLTASEAQTILGPLAGVSKTAGEAFDNAKKKAGGSIDKVKAGIVEIYSKYTDFRKKLIELVNERVTEQAAFSFIKEKTDTSDETTLMSFRVRDAKAPGVADLYSAIWSRRLEDFSELIKKAGTAIDDARGTYVTVLKNQERAQFSLNLFGLQTGTDVIFNDEVAVGVDHTGKLVIAKSKAELQTKRRRGSESQTLSAEWFFDFRSDDPTLMPPLKISVDVGDRSFDKKDLRDFFESLKKLECVKHDAFDEVGMELLGGVDSTRTLADAALGLVIALTWKELGAMLGANRDGTPRTDKWNAPEIGERLFRIVRRGHTRDDNFDDLDRAAREMGVDPFDLLLELGRSIGISSKSRSRLDKYHPIGRSIVLMKEHLTKLQAKWLELTLKFRPAKISPADEKSLAEAIETVDNELRSVLLEMFFSRTFPLLPQLSDIWQATCGSRLLLDLADREHLMLTIEGEHIARRVIS